MGHIIESVATGGHENILWFACVNGKSTFVLVPTMVPEAGSQSLAFIIDNSN